MNSSAHPRRILVIDDDPISLAVVCVLLEDEGFLVFQASSGEEAIAVLEAEPISPECVLADLRMPSLAGPALAEALRALLPDALLLAMSASPPAEVEGYAAVLRKPLSPESLRAFLSRGELQPEQAASHGSSFAVLDEIVFERLHRAMPLDGLEEVISAFVSDAGARIEAMRHTDPDNLRRQAHTIRGGAAMVGALQVSRIAAIIEAGGDHPDDRLRNLDELETSLRRAEHILKQRLQA